MRVVRIAVEAPVASFRYPHFLVGRQITFDMPPPSTIYGHVSSAVGRLVAPEQMEFAYHCTSRARADDLEHQHIFSIEERGRGKKKELSGAIVVQPARREFLFDVRLTLYLRATPDLLAEIGAAFRSPTFPVVLGRSQDLACVVGVEEIDLQEADAGYYESTLLPFSMRPLLPLGVTVLMPRFVGPPPEREAAFERYIVLHERAYAGDTATDIPDSRRVNCPAGTARAVLWVDPESPEDYGARRALVFHRFVA